MSNPSIHTSQHAAYIMICHSQFLHSGEMTSTCYNTIHRSERAIDPLPLRVSSTKASDWRRYHCHHVAQLSATSPDPSPPVPCVSLPHMPRYSIMQPPHIPFQACQSSCRTMSTALVSSLFPALSDHLRRSLLGHRTRHQGHSLWTLCHQIGSFSQDTYVIVIAVCAAPASLAHPC